VTADNILVSGLPGSGKSTLIEKVVRKINKPATGFFTTELRERNRRVGFAIITLDGKRGILAHRDIDSRYRVGKYGVNLRDLDQIGVMSLQPTTPGEIIIVDEIGKMECFSPLFKKTLLVALASDHQVIGSIALKGGQFIQRIKSRADVRLIHITETTRNSALAVFLEALES
jgi:nucleoside-triphosphatase